MLFFIYTWVGNAMPFLHEDKAWTFYYGNYFYSERYHHPSYEDRIMIKNKEIVGKNEYVLLQWEVQSLDSKIHGWMKGSTDDENGYDDIPTFSVHVREESGKVYILKEDYISFCTSKYGQNPVIDAMQTNGEEEVLIYDFNLKVGDTYPFPYHVTVKETGEMAFEGSVIPYQLLSNSLLIVEGIGCVNSFGGLIAYQSTPSIRYFDRYATYMYFVVAYDNQKDVFKYENFISEEQLLGISDAFSDIHFRNKSIHDLSGRCLKETPQKGIYISNGRKYVK